LYPVERIRLSLTTTAPILFLRHVARFPTTKAISRKYSSSEGLSVIIFNEQQLVYIAVTLELVAFSRVNFKWNEITVYREELPFKEKFDINL